MTIKKAALCAALAAGMTVGAAICASAADYSFEGVEAKEFYPSTRYESVCGARYNYDGRNVIDYDVLENAYGVWSSVSIGAAERVRLPSETTAASGSYGLPDEGAPVIYTTAPVMSVTSAYKPPSYTNVVGMEYSDGSIGTVKIPSLGISMKVWEGETNASMAKGLGHYSSSTGWDGNVCVCGHNRGAKYVIGSIKDLAAGDTITYSTVYGTRTYSVNIVGTISNTDWSHLQATSDNRITLTTCLANHPEYRVCVQAVEAG